MIGYGSEPPVVDRDAVASMSGEIAKMGLKYIATESELLALHQARNNGEKSAMVERLTVKGLDLVEAISRRIDVIKMEALTKGTLSPANPLYARLKQEHVRKEVAYGNPNTARL